MRLLIRCTDLTPALLMERVKRLAYCLKGMGSFLELIFFGRKHVALGTEIKQQRERQREMAGSRWLCLWGPSRRVSQTTSDYQNTNQNTGGSALEGREKREGPLPDKYSSRSWAFQIQPQKGKVVT